MPNSKIGECLQLLLQGIDVRGTTTVCHALSDLMQMHQQANDETLLAFAIRADKTVRAKQYQRITSVPLAKLSRDEIVQRIMASARELPCQDALDFLGDLAGAWILSCPETFIRQDQVFRDDAAAWVTTNDDLIFVLQYWMSYDLDPWTGRFFVGDIPEKYLAHRRTTIARRLVLHAPD